MIKINVKTRPFKEKTRKVAAKNPRPVKGVRWEVDVTLHFLDGLPPHRVRVIAPVNTEKQAKDWGYSLGAELAPLGRPSDQAPLPPPKKVMTFKEFVPVYLTRWVIEEGLTKSTYELRERQIEYFLPVLSSLPLDQITFDHVSEIKSSLRLRQDGLPRAPRSRNLLMSVLGHMLRQASEWELVNKLPPKMPKKVKQVDPEIETFTPTELERVTLAATAHSKEALLIVLLGADAGLRIAEMAGLRWSDIDLKEGRMVVRQQEDKAGEVTPTKSKKSRTIPLTPELSAALKSSQHLGERVLMRKGENIKLGQISYMLEVCERRAKVIHHKSPHKLRHTFASRLLARGASATSVQVLLGHRSLKTTIGYLHLQTGEVEAAIKLLSGERPETKEEEVKR